MSGVNPGKYSTGVWGSSTDTARTEVCWACQNRLFFTDEPSTYAQGYKCGWCGALSHPAGWIYPGNGFSETKLGHIKEISTTNQLFNHFMRLGIWVVTLVIAVIALASFWLIFDVACGAWWCRTVHALSGTFILAHIVTHLRALAVLSPGTAEELVGHRLHSFGRIIPNRAFEDYTHCAKCDYYKPPGAHHCGLCNKCIVDMDHHCYVLGTCIGRANLPHFLRFLLWTSASQLYLLVLACWTLQQQRSLLRSCWQGALRRSGSTVLEMIFWYWLCKEMPARALGVLYLVGLSIGLLLGLGGLFASQAALVYRGCSYISHLQSGGSSQNVTRNRRSWKRLQVVLGLNNVFACLELIKLNVAPVHGGKCAQTAKHM